MTENNINILVTGGCGFIGSNFIRLILKNKTGINMINIDRLTYAGNLANLKDIEDENSGNYTFLKGDIADKDFIFDLFSRNKIDWVVNFAAESHVDRSILGPEDFIRTNIYGTFNLLEAAREKWLLKPTEISKKRFLHISTDEVYGSLSATGLFSERSPYDPSSPYSASKASSDHLVRAYFRTYGLPALITNCTNNYGPYQFTEKLIPLMINNAFKGEKLPLYGDGKYVRDWLHVEDHCRAILLVLERGKIGECYNIGGNCEKENRDVVFLICDLLDRRVGSYQGKPRRELIHFVTDRPGHDRRYALDASKIRTKLGWEPEIPFEDGLKSTVEWYIDNQEWVADILNGSYMEYYQKQYGDRIDGGR
jgi:dTDP-glucose 4,6-dehydratase